MSLYHLDPKVRYSETPLPLETRSDYIYRFCLVPRVADFPIAKRKAIAVRKWWDHKNKAMVNVWLANGTRYSIHAEDELRYVKRENVPEGAEGILFKNKYGETLSY
jgi:hypothetical protein